MATIALLTDFGDRDGFVGVMKGVIHAIHLDIRVIDIAHHIPPQNVRHGSWVLAQAFETFGPETIFVTVVDPMVGHAHQSALLAMFNPGRLWIGPNNGLLTRVAKKYPPQLLIQLHDVPFITKPLSQTFHGRDLYAPVAAHTAMALADERLQSFLETLGPVCHPTMLQYLPLCEPGFSGHTINAEVDVIDTFGNVITNIPNTWLDRLQGRSWQLQAANIQASLVIAPAYGEAGDELALVSGSHGALEVACFSSRADQRLGLSEGQAIVFQGI